MSSVRGGAVLISLPLRPINQNFLIVYPWWPDRPHQKTGAARRRQPFTATLFGALSRHLPSRRLLSAALLAAGLRAANVRGLVVDNQTGRPVGRATVFVQPIAG